MFTRRFVALTLIVAGLVGSGLVFLVDTPPLTAACIALSLGAIAGLTPAVVRDGRFPGTLSSSRARRGMLVAHLIILSGGMLGVTALDLDRGTDLSLKLLVLATGYAGFWCGAATTILEADDPARAR